MSPALELVGASPVLHARITGLVGMVTLASGSFAGTVASRLVVRDDVPATASNIVASASLFRLGLTCSLIMMIAFLFYGLLLYRLLRRVNANHALLMLALVVAAVPVYMLNQVNQFALLPAASAGLDEQLKLFLELHRLGNLIGGIFFGLWLLPLGLLVYKSGFIPKVLGLLLILGTPGYLVLFGQAFFFPGAERTLWSNPFLVVTHVSELALLLWLLVRGVNVDAWERHRPPTETQAALQSKGPA